MAQPGDHRALYFQWEVRTWSRALPLWQRALRRVPGRGGRALALGERDGGLSLLLAEHGFMTICSDLYGPTDRAKELHETRGRGSAVTHEAIDATAIPKPDAFFDVVAFKSMLGALGSKERQMLAIHEVHRVLKPGGVLLFAENACATRLHARLRRRFVAWEHRWRYLHPVRDRDLFRPFVHLHHATTGFLAPLGRSEVQRDLLARLDGMLVPLLPRTWRTVWYGVALKGGSVVAG